jgi:hypothetical protein
VSEPYREREVEGREGSVGDKEGGSNGRNRERGGGERDIVCER